MQLSPDVLRNLFDANWVLVAFAVGLLWKYLPQLKALTNQAIPWVNFGAYVLVKLAGVGTANAAGFDTNGVVVDVVGVIIGGFTNAVWARQLYEGWGRGVMEGLLGRRKRRKA